MTGSSSFGGGGMGIGGGGGGGGGGFGGFGGANNSQYGGSQYGGSAFGGSQYGGAQQYGGAYNNQYAATQPQTPAANPFNQSAIANAAGGTCGAPPIRTRNLSGCRGRRAGRGPSRIVPNPFDNTLLVQSTPDQWEQISKLLEQIDVSPRQVLIDAKIYEIDLTGAFWLAWKRTSRTRAPPMPRESRRLCSTDLVTPRCHLRPGAMVGQARQLAALSANELVTKVKVLSSPSIIATDSIPAFITVGSSVPTLSSQAVNPGITSGGNSLFTNTVSNVSTGTGLNILARVNPSGVVTMVIDQSVTAPQPNSSSGIDSPSFSQREVSTQVTVDDGDMIAIGGIINDNHTDSITGIPFLDRLPYLGFLFGQKSTTTSRTELIVFLTPHVIYDTHHISDATQELKDQMKGLKQIIKQNP